MYWHWHAIRNRKGEDARIHDGQTAIPPRRRAARRSLMDVIKLLLIDSILDASEIPHGPYRSMMSQLVSLLPALAFALGLPLALFACGYIRVPAGGDDRSLRDTPMSHLLGSIGWRRKGGRKDGPIRVSCVGDSITFHGCASNESMTYPSQLQRLLGTGYEVHNFGDSGKCMLKNGLCGNGGDPIPQCDGDCSYWHQDTFPDALHSSPDIVTIMLGTNDAKYCNFYSTERNGSPRGIGVGYREAYLDMIDMFRRLPSNPKIYVAIPPPLTHPPGHPDLPPPFNMSSNVINGIYPVLIRSIAADAGVDGIIDTWSALGGVDMDPDKTCDGCHPKDEAFGIIAKTFAAGILRGGEMQYGSMEEQ